MILDEIVLHNFGVYGGRQAAVLTPPSPTRPVILFGGLNGGGKTTLLDGLNLALYGRRARCSNRGGLAYEEYLRRSIHRRSAPEDGASVEVQFRSRSEGRERLYRVTRSWTASGSSVRENVEVHLDGALDRVLTDAWDEHVEEFLPVGLSQLFLFDGEKIEGLADLDNSAQFLSSAINSLLGLELIDQLVADLQTLEKRKRVGSKKETERAKVEKAQVELQELEAQLKQLASVRATAQNELDQCEKKLTALDARFRREGGEIFEQQGRLEDQKASVSRQLNEVEETLRDAAAGAAPLVLVADLLAVMESQDRHEEAAGSEAVLAAALAERDTLVVTKLRKERASAKLISQIDRFLTEDREGRARHSHVEPWLTLGLEGREQLRALRRSGLRETQDGVNRLLHQAEQLHGTVVELDRKLAGAPDKAAIATLVKQRHEAQTKLEQGRARLLALDGEIEQLRGRRDHRQARLTSEIERVVDEDFEREDASRIVAHSARARSTLGTFRDRVIGAHVHRIERLVLESFVALVRKQSLVSSIKIDPKTFAVELRGADQRVLEPERLSAGERQLLAVAMLWGLARAAGRPIPAVIDTPLGRLDSTHREHLVERYFPKASHQVLLLSTDEEIDAANFDRLKPWIGRSYRLEFDDEVGSTSVTPGYFW
ncbi:MAG TPA: DNA sulfur modification protein DndD [Planctomycetota bacterium]|nr:DNA sulfur modification protein DndD [Planctomycetota bacterium]